MPSTWWFESVAFGGEVCLPVAVQTVCTTQGVHGVALVLLSFVPDCTTTVLYSSTLTAEAVLYSIYAFSIHPTVDQECRVMSRCWLKGGYVPCALVPSHANNRVPFTYLRLSTYLYSYCYCCTNMHFASLISKSNPLAKILRDLRCTTIFPGAAALPLVRPLSNRKFSDSHCGGLCCFALYFPTAFVVGCAASPCLHFIAHFAFFSVA